MNSQTLIRLCVAAFLLGAGSMASAAPTYCSAPGAHADGLDVSDVTYSATNAAPFTNATDCYGVVSGNINPSTDVNGIWGTGWAYADANNENAVAVNLFGGSFTFTLQAANGATSGTYILSATDNNGGVVPPNFPFNIDFIFSTKAGNSYALYYFDDVLFDGSGGGSWKIVFDKNPAGNPPALSHGIIFVREGTTTRVPEPMTLSLLGIGLLAGAAVRRRRRLN